MTDDHTLASLIGSRICHDLISPIGAITNGLELLQMSGEVSSPEMALIGESVESASARLRFYRIAFGSAGDQMVGAPEVQAILRDLFESSRLNVSWTPTTPKPRAAVRLAFLAILCMENGMPYGGTLTISCESSAWKLHGQADRLNIDKTIWPLLTTDSDHVGLQPAHVQFALLPMIASDDGRTVATDIGVNEITLSF